MILKTLHAAKDPFQPPLSPLLQSYFTVGTHNIEPEADPSDLTPAQGYAQPALRNAALRRCVNEHDQAFQTSIDSGNPETEASLAANKAYRSAMPPLDDRDEIRDFIACVAHGMLLGVFEAKDAARLLYAAQVAYSAALKPCSRPGRPRRDYPYPSSVG